MRARAISRPLPPPVEPRPYDPVAHSTEGLRWCLRRLNGPFAEMYTDQGRRALGFGAFSHYRQLCALGERERAEEEIGRAQRWRLRREAAERKQV